MGKQRDLARIAALGQRQNTIILYYQLFRDDSAVFEFIWLEGNTSFCEHVLHWLALSITDSYAHSDMMSIGINLQLYTHQCHNTSSMTQLIKCVSNIKRHRCAFVYLKMEKPPRHFGFQSKLAQYPTSAKWVWIPKGCFSGSSVATFSGRGVFMILHPLRQMCLAICSNEKTFGLHSFSTLSVATVAELSLFLLKLVFLLIKDFLGKKKRTSYGIDQASGLETFF